MKAAILEKYASDGRELIVRDIPIPAIADDEVLVKVVAAAVNPLDNMIVRGEVKLIVPYRFPLVMGNELKKISAIFAEKQVQTSLDEVFTLDEVNKAMKKVASGRSRGKTIIKVY